MTSSIRDIMTKAPVIPVMVIESPELAVPLAEALMKGGLPALEITLRTPAALECIDRIARTLPDALVGAGTVNTEEQMRAVSNAGARFTVSPGFTPSLSDAARQLNMPFLPGVANASTILQAMEYGHQHLKFFPAGPAGGIHYLKALAGPFQDVFFCPTGGVSDSNYHDYLALNNVLCVGGSWVCPADLVREQNWDAITKLAAACHHPALQ